MPDGPEERLSVSASPSGSIAVARYWYGWPTAPATTGVLVKYGGVFVCGAPGRSVNSPTLIVLTIDVPGSLRLPGRPFQSAHKNHWLVTIGAATKFDQAMLP